MARASQPRVRRLRPRDTPGPALELHAPWPGAAQAGSPFPWHWGLCSRTAPRVSAWMGLLCGHGHLGRVTVFAAIL